MKLDLLASLNSERAARRGAVLVTYLGSGEQRLVRAAQVGDDPLHDLIAPALRSGRSGRAEGPGGEALFLAVHAPALRLVVVGAVHVTQAMVPMAGALGLDLTVIDPRGAFAAPERFPGVALLPEWPQDALPSFALGPHDALATLTHDPKIDDPALTAALAAGCFYVGALGSRRTHAARVERLGAAGVAREALARVRAPIGLPLGAATPAEIALAILAEVTAARRLPPADPRA